MKMKKPKLILIVAVMMVFSTLAVSLIISENVSAHSPAAIYPTYKEGTLTVYIDHASDDPDSHYIKTGTVLVNDIEYLSETYTSQSVDDKGKGMVTYSYPVPASNGDVISVTAVCSIDGTITEILTVGDGDDKEDPDKDYPDKDYPDKDKTNGEDTKDDATNVGNTSKYGDSNQDNGEIIMLLGAIAGVLVVIIVLIAMLMKKQNGTTKKSKSKKDKINKDEWTSCPKCGSSVRLGQLPAHLDTVHPKLTKKSKEKMIDQVVKSG